MTNIFMLSAQPDPTLESITDKLKSTYPVTSVNSAEALKEFNHEPGLVFVCGTAEKLNSLVPAVRFHAPKMSCIMVVPTVDLDTVPEPLLSQADLLSVPFVPAELQARTASASQLSELRHVLATTAQLDESTGIYTQGYFLKRLGEEISLAKRHLSPLSCVIMTFPAYAFYLDTYGYDAVMSILKGFAEVSQKQVRNEDVIARVGDSDIALLLPRSTEKGALALTQRIVNKIALHPFILGDEEEYLEVKAGIAGFPTPGEDANADADMLIRYARHALHHARCNDDVSIQCFADLKPAMS